MRCKISLIVQITRHYKQKEMKPFYLTTCLLLFLNSFCLAQTISYAEVSKYKTAFQYIRESLKSDTIFGTSYTNHDIIVSDYIVDINLDKNTFEKMIEKKVSNHEDYYWLRCHTFHFLYSSTIHKTFYKSSQTGDIIIFFSPSYYNIITAEVHKTNSLVNNTTSPDDIGYWCKEFYKYTFIFDENDNIVKADRSIVYI